MSDVTRDFWVSQIRDGRWRKIAGPFQTLEEAESEVPTARERVCAVDPWSDFDAFGTCSTPRQSHVP